ncbi:hypothetical protein ACP70R_002997 [Stipagrostis hirtigluma subsp. patula]
MDLTLAMVLLALLIFSLLLKIVFRYTTPAPRLPPGPWRLPIVGSLHHLLLSPHRNQPHLALCELSTRYGPLMLLRLGSVPTLVVSSAEAVREVTKTHDLAFCSRHLSPTIDIITCGGRDIVFSPYNDQWRELRKICVLELLSQRRVLHFRPVREEEVARLVTSISGECSSSSHPINLSEKIRRMVNDVVMRAAIGRRCDEHRDELLQGIDEALRLAGAFNLVDLYPSSTLIRRCSAATWVMRRCQKKIYKIIANIIHDRAMGLAPGREEDDDLLSVLLRLQKTSEPQCPLTDEIISGVIFDMFVAGNDTSSSTLEWAMSELIKNPRVLRKAQLEVRDTFKGKEILTEDDMAKLCYLHLVIKEALRLHPPAPLIYRECRETCQVMGYQVPKGTAVFLNVLGIGRDRRYWDVAEEFMPERFHNSNIDFKGTDFEYIPFGTGRRICPGIHFARANMELALASLLYHFDWEIPGGVNAKELDMADAFGISVRRKSMLCLNAKPHVTNVQSN